MTTTYPFDKLRTYQALHFTFDAVGIDKELLMDREILKTSMEALVSLCGMMIMLPPQVAVVEDTEKAWGSGVSVLIMISDSHLAMNTMVKKSRISWLKCGLFRIIRLFRNRGDKNPSTHLAVHTVADKGHVYFDLFSCKDFDYKELLNSLLLIFDPQWWQSDIRSRAIEEG